MIMKSVNSNIEKSKQLLSAGKMYDAMLQMLSSASVVSEYTKTLTFPGIREDVEAVKEDYERMLLFFSDGMKDPDRETIYDKYSQKLLVIVRKMELMYLINTYSVYSAAYKRTVNFNATLIDEKLKSFSEEIKRCEDVEKGNVDALRNAYKQKADYDNLLFSYLLIAPQWNENDSQLFLDLIVSGKADPITSSLMVSAITLSCMSIYDFQKLQCLVQVYMQTTDVCVKERALVGWAWGMHGALMQSEKDMQKALIAKLCQEDPDAIMELTELQKQLLFSLDTKKLSEDFQKNIDKLIKEKLPFGYIKGDSLDGSDMEGAIFEDEDKFDLMDSYFDKIKEMETSGIDIYFEGFSKMKNFAFFHTFSNWFVPYYFENPALRGSQNFMDETSMTAIDKLLSARSHICDSDKYSMAFAICMTMKHSPELGKVMSQMKDLGPLAEEHKLSKNPSMVRRQYLQTLYRFSKLCTMNTYLDDPFDEQNKDLVYFLCRREFDTELFDKPKMALCRYLTKQKDYARLGELLYACRQTNHVDYMMMKALFEFYHEHDYSSALHCLTTVLLKNPNNVPALKLVGRCYYFLENYEDAANVYERLIEVSKHPDTYKVQLACCLLQTGEIHEGVQMLFEQEYHHPDQKEILRPLAWGLMQRGQLDKALDYYTRLIGVTAGEKGQERADDLYYIGVVCFCLHDIKQAIIHFTQFLQVSPDEDLTSKLRQDEPFMAKYDLTPVDVKLMEDAIKLSFNNK